jgi:methylated-DNA-[protein]-cysteine S-methyltransferase
MAGGLAMVLCKVDVGCELGELVGVVDGEWVVALTPAEGWPKLRGRVSKRFGSVELREAPTPKPLARAVQRYFAGDLDVLGDVPVDPGGSDFQARVWAALQRIPAGERRTYVEVAKAIGRPRSIRAVSQAVAANPIQLAIPCHRVVGAGGRIPGTRELAERRRWLLDHEEQVRAREA